MSGTIQIRTAIPGPRSQELMRRRAQAVPRGVYHATPIFAARAEGAVVEDVDGNRFLDFAGGIGCSNVGHRAPAVMAAVRGQVDRFLHTCFSVAPYEAYVSLAERLNELTPGKFVKKTLLVNSGAEAVENAVKIARAFTGRPAVVCFEHAFHGRTLLALSLTSKMRPYKAGFEPFVPDVHRIPFGFCYECASGKKHNDCSATIGPLQDLFKKISTDSIAALVAEPVLGEGGFLAPPADYFQKIGALCRKHGILLIADEVQTSIARTGTLFACEQYGIEPDIVVAAKSLGGGLPIASITGRADVMDAPSAGGLGGTFTGNPVSCEAALAVLEMVERENLCLRARQLGDTFVARAGAWRKRWPQIRYLHGLGAMRSIELRRVDDSPADEEVRAISRYCYEHGLLTISAGTYNNIIRLLMPLVISDAQFQEGLNVMEAGLAEVFSGACRPEQKVTCA